MDFCQTASCNDFLPRTNAHSHTQFSSARTLHAYVRFARILIAPAHLENVTKKLISVQKMCENVRSHIAHPIKVPHISRTSHAHSRMLFARTLHTWECARTCARTNFFLQLTVWFLQVKYPVFLTWFLHLDFSKIKYRSTGGIFDPLHFPFRLNNSRSMETATD